MIFYVVQIYIHYDELMRNAILSSCYKIWIKETDQGENKLERC